MVSSTTSPVGQTSKVFISGSEKYSPKFMIFPTSILIL